MLHYLEGILEAGTKALEDHLGTCASCRKRYQALRDLYAGLGDDRAVPVIEDLPDRVMSRLIAAPGPEDAPLLDFALAGCAVLLAAVALAAFAGIGPLTFGLAALGRGIRHLALQGDSPLRSAPLLCAAAVILLVYLANGLVLRRAGNRRHHT